MHRLRGLRQPLPKNKTVQRPEDQPLGSARRTGHHADVLRPQLDQLVALAEVDDLWAVGAWYQRFEPVSDRDVLQLMAACSEDRASSGAMAHQRERSDRL